MKEYYIVHDCVMLSSGMADFSDKNPTTKTNKQAKGKLIPNPTKLNQNVKYYDKVTYTIKF